MDDAGDQALGLAVRKLRTERGWSEADLALRVGMDRNDLSLVELGCNSSSVRMLKRAVHGAGCARGRPAGRRGAARAGAKAVRGVNGWNRPENWLQPLWSKRWKLTFT